MNKKQITALATCVATVAIAVVGGTLAYFTDTDEATNTFTLGNVTIALHEGAYENVQKNGAPINGDGEVDVSKANPNDHSKDDNFGYDYLDEVKDASYKGWLSEQTLMPGAQSFNRMQKRVFVENTGSYDAYVRVIVGIPTELDNAKGVSSNNILHMNQVTGEVNNNLGHWVEITNVTPDFSQDGYNYYIINYTEKLESGDCTDAEAISYFWLDGKVDNDGTNYYYMNGDEKVVLESLANGKIEIPVYAEAIQADGFDTYTAAWAAYGDPAIKK